MDTAGLLLGMLVSAPLAALWPGGRYAAALVLTAVVAALATAGGMLLWQRRRHLQRVKAAPPSDPAYVLKERLRRRLAEPLEAFALFAGAVPTVGAGEIAEGDLDAAVKDVLAEAGWRPGIARQVLRQRLNGHATAANALNGSEAVRWRQLGALALIEDADDAVAAYSRAADLAPDDVDVQMLLGNLYLRTGRLAAAETTFRRQIERAKTQTDAAGAGKEGAEVASEAKSGAEVASEGEAKAGSDEPSDVRSDREAVSEDKRDAEAMRLGAIRYRTGLMLGDVLLAKGEREAALAAYEAARAEVLELAEREPDHPRWRRDASVAHDRLGDLLLAEGQSDAALECFRKSLEICEALAAAAPANADRQHDLSVAYDRVGEALDHKGELEGALESYRQGLARAEAAAQLAPHCALWRWDVSASHDRIGDVLAAQGKPSDALAAYRSGLEIAEPLAAAEPTRIHWQRDLAVSCHKVGLLEAQLGRQAEAREALEQGKAIIARLAEVARYHAQWQADLASFKAALKGLDK